MGKLLITGFTPFGGEQLNPSQVLAQSLSLRLGSQDCLILPVSYRRAFAELLPYLASGRFDRVLSLGQASGRRSVCLERVALNLHDSEQADEDGELMIESEIKLGAPHAYLNPLPIRKIHQEVKALGLGPIEVSSSCGTFVCNSIYYQMFHWQQQQPPPQQLKWQLFVHLPYFPEQVVGKCPETAFVPQSVQEELLLALVQRLPQNETAL